MSAADANRRLSVGDVLGAGRAVTREGCRVHWVKRRQRSGLIVEEITLEHPLELAEVAIGRERILERAGGAR